MSSNGATTMLIRFSVAFRDSCDKDRLYDTRWNPFVHEAVVNDIIKIWFILVTLTTFLELGLLTS